MIESASRSRHRCPTLNRLRAHTSDVSGAGLELVILGARLAATTERPTARSSESGRDHRSGESRGGWTRAEYVAWGFQPLPCRPRARAI